MAKGFVDLTVEQLATPEGIGELNRMLRAVFDLIGGDGENVRIIHGIGSPEGAVSAGIGSIYMRTDGSTDTTMYRKESGTGATGWVAVVNTVAPSVEGVKGWASITYAGGVPTLQDSFNVSGITDDGVGKITVTWDTDFASTNYCVVATPKKAVASLLMTAQVESIAVGSVAISIWQQGGAVADPDALYVMAIGDQ